MSSVNCQATQGWHHDRKHRHQISFFQDTVSVLIAIVSATKPTCNINNGVILDWRDDSVSLVLIISVISSVVVKLVSSDVVPDNGW